MMHPDPRSALLDAAADFGLPATMRTRSLAIRLDATHSMRILFDTIGRLLNVEYDDDESPNGLRRIAGPDKLDRAIAKMRTAFEVREFDARREATPPFNLHVWHEESWGRRVVGKPAPVPNSEANVHFPECPECGARPGQAHDPECSVDAPTHLRPFCGDTRAHEPHRGSSGPCFGTVGPKPETEPRQVIGERLATGAAAVEHRIAGPVSLDRIGPADEPHFEVSKWDDDEGAYVHAAMLSRAEAEALYHLLGRELMG